MGHFCFTSMLENPGKFGKNHGKIREFDSENLVGTLSLVPVASVAKISDSNRTIYFEWPDRKHEIYSMQPFINETIDDAGDPSTLLNAYTFVRQTYLTHTLY